MTTGPALNGLSKVWASQMLLAIAENCTESAPNGRETARTRTIAHQKQEWLTKYGEAFAKHRRPHAFSVSCRVRRSNRSESANAKTPMSAEYAKKTMYPTPRAAGVTPDRSTAAAKFPGA